VVLNDINIDKPVLLIGAAPNLKQYLKPDAYKNFFTITIGKALYATNYTDLLFSIDLVRVVHNLSNFSDRWGHYLVPHFITHHFWDSRSSGIFETGSWKIEFNHHDGTSKPYTDDSRYRYPLSPEHNSMAHHFLDFRSVPKFTVGKHDGSYLIAGSLKYEDVDEIVDFSKYKNITKFTRDDIWKHNTDKVDAYHQFLHKDGKLRNDCNSTHFALNWLWMKGIKNIYTVGVSKDYHKWDDTEKIMNMYDINCTRVEDAILDKRTRNHITSPKRGYADLAERMMIE